MSGFNPTNATLGELFDDPSHRDVHARRAAAGYIEAIRDDLEEPAIFLGSTVELVDFALKSLDYLRTDLVDANHGGHDEATVEPAADDDVDGLDDDERNDVEEVFVKSTDVWIVCSDVIRHLARGVKVPKEVREALYRVHAHLDSHGIAKGKDGSWVQAAPADDLGALLHHLTDGRIDHACPAYTRVRAALATQPDPTTKATAR